MVGGWWELSTRSHAKVIMLAYLNLLLYEK